MENILKHLFRVAPCLMIFSLWGTICSAQADKPSRDVTLPQAEYTLKTWQEFSSPEGHFTILFSGKPAEHSEMLDTPAGRLEKRIYALETTLATYVVAYDDLAPFSYDSSTIQKMLDSGREQAIASEKGRLLSEKNISLDGYPGREMVVEIPEGILKTRMYVTRQRLYQIIVVMPEPRASAGEKIRFEESIADKFLDSFKLTMKADGQRTKQASLHPRLKQLYADKQYFELRELLQG